MPSNQLRAVMHIRGAMLVLRSATNNRQADELVGAISGIQSTPCGFECSMIPQGDCMNISSAYLACLHHFACPWIKAVGISQLFWSEGWNCCSNSVLLPTTPELSTVVVLRQRLRDNKSPKSPRNISGSNFLETVVRKDLDETRGAPPIRATGHLSWFRGLFHQLWKDSNKVWYTQLDEETCQSFSPSWWTRPLKRHSIKKQLRFQTEFQTSFPMVWLVR